MGLWEALATEGFEVELGKLSGKEVLNTNVDIVVSNGDKVEHVVWNTPNIRKLQKVGEGVDFTSVKDELRDDAMSAVKRHFESKIGGESKKVVPVEEKKEEEDVEENREKEEEATFSADLFSNMDF